MLQSHGAHTIAFDFVAFLGAYMRVSSYGWPSAVHFDLLGGKRAQSYRCAVSEGTGFFCDAANAHADELCVKRYESVPTGGLLRRTIQGTFLQARLSDFPFRVTHI